MAQRGFRRVSGGLEGRSERPATGHGQPWAVTFRNRVNQWLRVP
jgi:hypothetical protein